MEQSRQIMAAIAWKRIALRKGKTTAKVREEIRKAILIGLCSQDPRVQTYWKQIPCEGIVPTPEDVIPFFADEVKSNGRP